jgi:peroxiredoxin (alkyl hydroperoxide reductase subunit C)
MRSKSGKAPRKEQQTEINTMLVGKKAPEFSASAVVNSEIVNDFSLEQYLGRQYVLLFFYPKDFTFVCPTELIGFQNALPEFEKRNTAVVGCSTDSEFCHWAWVNTPRNQGGIQGVAYPLVADINKEVAAKFDVLADEGDRVAYRGLFLIDKEGVVRHQLINDMPLGRSIDEAIRIVDALQHFEQFGEVCPMGWHKGEAAMQATHEGVAGYLADK